MTSKNNETHDRFLELIQIEKDLLEEMAKKNEMLADANSLKDLFLAVASHDLLTPLNVVQTTCEKILYGNTASGLNPDQLNAFQRIQSSAFYMTYIIRDLLNNEVHLSSIPVHFERENLSPILKECIGNHTTLAAEDGITIVDSVQEDLPPLWIDPVRMREVFNNLISNALKFTPKGGQVTVTAKPENGHIVAAVKDSGRGIPKEDIPKIFAPYKRLIERVGEKGYGLGLYIVKEIIGLHGGEIQVWSEPGKGSCFRVILKVDEQSPPGKRPRPAKGQAKSHIALFGEVAIEKGYVDSKDVLECLNIQQKENMLGKRRMIGEILLEKKLITTPQLVGILEELARRKEG